ncbi:ABC transporter substrate-binding protein [Cupriavidus taiwanensis]|uniref:ABC transporter substrate-binding protein n=1 Tax=Cupriavidus taiwanensis TaxID=164546 RepID=UPI000E10B01B|nr:ABC transporter substrate-binding protein [Cupriavidus taiwanensis]SOY67009.1 ABC transporter substrate-binding protein [Cupriavidus taiwanensis]SOY67046.1 ABC transporter substrate-binding protein [Cupriavidus taiwanensis]SOY94755.1 ABC transporter substrate-binding protein [Cupriavidus taiwanensis]SOZ28102.1 ABC transporter substrate-binding protein [Cupriavidus taiwanensis]SOZ71590.1 ABC transporter substrate-binding protein [Cupriavidus taiwanensis]
MKDRCNEFASLVGPGESLRILDGLKRGATRRDVLKMLLAGGMQATLAGSLAGQALEAHAQTPRRGGRIRVAAGTASASDTLDPAKQANQNDYVRCNMVYNGLTSLDASLTPRPALAESFNTTDAKTWVFALRKGVTFHDGKALSPADVVYSVMRHKDPATASKGKVLAEQIESVKATGPGEVTMVLTQPNADLPVILGTSHFQIVKDGTTDFSAGIGTGPYKIKEFRPGVRTVAVRNEAYWKPGKPYLDEIEFVGITDESARVNALLSGEMDLVAMVNPRAVARIKGTPGYGLMITRSGQYTDLILRKDVGPGTNPDFIMGMKYLLDREQMKQAIALGNAVIGNDQPIDPTNRFYFKELPQRPFDPEKAKFHLRKAGVTGKVPVVTSPAALYSVEMALMLQQAAQRVGLELDIKRMPADGYWSNHWLNSPVGFGNVNPRPSADTILTQFFKSDAPWNESRWKNPRFDQLLLGARAETDFAKRKQLYADMQTMIHAEAGIGIPLFLSSIDAHSTKLKGLSPIPLGGLMGYAFAEHVWLDA